MVLQDNVIFERLTEASQYKDLTVAHLEQFATEGKKKGKKTQGGGVMFECRSVVCLTGHPFIISAPSASQRSTRQTFSDCSLPF